MSARRLLKGMCYSLLVLILVSCQSSNPDEALKIEQEAQPAVSQSETHGSGPVQIFMILNRSGGLSNSAENQMYPAGASLGVEVLAQSDVTLTILDAKSDSSLYRQHVETATNAPAQLIVIGPDRQLNETISQVKLPQSIPVISLSRHQTNGIYPFIASDDAGLETAMKYAIDKGKTKLAIVYPADVKNDVAELLSRIGKQRDFNFVEVSYPKRANAKVLVSQNQEYLKSADCVVLFGNDNETGTLAREIKAVVAGQDVLLLSRNDVSSALILSPNMDGVIMATTDFSGLGGLNAQLVESGKKPLSETSAYAFDTIATIAGLIRTFGQNGITKTNLQKGSGFKGATGSFKFHSDGRVQRLLTISQIRGGKLQTIEPAPAGF